MSASLALACFMARPVGRILRIVFGLALLGWGWTLRGTTPGTVLLIVGWVPVLAGVLNLCILGPLFGAPFSGRKALEMERDRAA